MIITQEKIIRKVKIMLKKQLFFYFGRVKISQAVGQKKNNCLIFLHFLIKISLCCFARNKCPTTPISGCFRNINYTIVMFLGGNMLDNPMILEQLTLDDPFFFERLLGRFAATEDSDDEL